MHEGELKLTKLTYTRLEDNLTRHRGDRRYYILQPHCITCPTITISIRRLIAKLTTNKSAIPQSNRKKTRSRWTRQLQRPKYQHLPLPRGVAQPPPPPAFDLAPEEWRPCNPSRLIWQLVRQPRRASPKRGDIDQKPPVLWRQGFDGVLKRFVWHVGSSRWRCADERQGRRCRFTARSGLQCNIVSFVCDVLSCQYCIPPAVTLPGVDIPSLS